MSDTTENTPPAEPAGRTDEQQQLAEQLVDRANTEGLDLVGPDGVLTGLTKKVLDSSPTPPPTGCSGRVGIT